MEKKSTGMDKRKKRALIFVIAVLVIAVLSGVLLYVIDRVEANEETEPTNKYSNELHSYIFYPPEYDLDVTTVEEYMELDRMLYYKYGAEEFGIDGNAEKYGKDVAFFEKYFELVIAGKWEEYNKLFTDNYYKSNDPENEFAPQMLYDMHIEKLWEDVDDAEERAAFNVSYRIYRNNGTFRNDIDSGAAKVLYFEIVKVNGEYKIDRITYYV